MLLGTVLFVLLGTVLFDTLSDGKCVKKNRPHLHIYIKHLLDKSGDML